MFCDVFLMTKKSLGGGFMFFYFHPYLGEMIQFDEHIFQRGLVKPPTRSEFWGHLDETGALPKTNSKRSENTPLKKGK